MDRRQKHESDRIAKNPLCISLTQELDCSNHSDLGSPEKQLLVHVHNSQKDLKIDKKKVQLLVQEVLAYLGSSHSEVSVYFVTERKICALHDQFFQDPSPTDCISFPLDDTHLGEVFVCPKAALTFDPTEPYQETALYVIHGLLHCLGYDDLEPVEKRAMRKKEKSCMALINKLGIHLAP